MVVFIAELFETYYPEIIGPRTGPRNTLAEKRLTASPLVSAAQISAITPKEKC